MVALQLPTDGEQNLRATTPQLLATPSLVLLTF
jgi:hypothetical protein